ncbi:MAG TPA: SDR family oxidoreductase [Caldimonas sp.]|nr:SDR family oxidoreductase [Caldimonas sp.]
MQLRDKVSLVFGASSGIGAAVALRFAREGAHVVAAGLPGPVPGEEAGALGVEARPCDVTVEEQVRAVVREALERHGRIDVLINSAGIIISDEACSIDDRVWAEHCDVNLTGTMRTMRAVLPHMLERGGGAIVNIASVAAFNGGAASASYAASKAGVVALTRSAAQACGARGVRVNALCPGWVDTPMSAREMDELACELGISVDEARERTIARISLARMARPEEMAAACLFLASDESSFVTGAALVADGGSRVPAAARAV